MLSEEKGRKMVAGSICPFWSVVAIRHPFPAGAAAERRRLADGLGSEVRNYVRSLSDQPAGLSEALIVGHLS